jgi:hypothetical protein
MVTDKKIVLTRILPCMNSHYMCVCFRFMVTNILLFLLISLTYLTQYIYDDALHLYLNLNLNLKKVHIFPRTMHYFAATYKN